ncbi:MAG: hypothetical protein ABIG93_00630 [archaeon]|nr:hypothetical protein [Nanoarchaeota archaeon]
MARRRRKKVENSDNGKYKWGMFFAAMVACICIVILVLSLTGTSLFGCRDGALAGQAYAVIATAGLETDGEVIRLLITEPIIAEGNVACDFDNDGAFDEVCMIEVDYQGKYTVTDIASGEAKEQGNWLVGLMVY